MEGLPLTASGKVDRKALPEPERGGSKEGGYEAPGSRQEWRLARIWEELLSVERVGVGDNFFALGGHSLLATRVVSAISRELGVELSIRDVFVYPTVRSLSGYLSGRRKGLTLPAVEREERPLYVPLSFSQERLWFIDQLE